VDKLPANKNLRKLTALSVVDKFFSGPSDLWQAIAQSANDHIRTAQLLGTNPAYGLYFTSTRVRLVFFLRLRLTANPGTSLKQAYLDPGLGRYLLFDRFVLIPSQAALSPDTRVKLSGMLGCPTAPSFPLANPLQLRCPDLLQSRNMASP
jgi:hypothetical protein